MNWNYVATFTGTGSIAHLPSGTVDESGSLWVMWGDAGEGKALTYFSQPVPRNGASFPVKATRLPQGTNTSPCLMRVHGRFVTLWDEVREDTLCWGVLEPKAGSLDLKGTFYTHEADGPLAAFFPVADSLFIAFRRHYEFKSFTDDPDFLYNNVIGLGTPEPHALGNETFLNVADTPYKSYYSPAVTAMPGEKVAVLWKGIGRPGDAGSDNKLYFVSAPQSLRPAFPSAVAPVRYPGPGGASVTATCTNRPSLALHGTGPAATLVAVYPGTTSGHLSYLVGTPNDKGVTWAAPPQNGTSDGTVPLRDLLANAGPGGGPVTLTNPVGVWVTAPEHSNTLYLLVGDQSGDTIAGPLYLVRYMGHT